MRRGPQQVLRGDEGKGKQSALPETARAALGQMLKEGLGDHVLLLRLYQVSVTAPSELDDGLLCPSPSYPEQRHLYRWAARQSFAMQAWEQNNFQPRWCRDMRLDVRGMNFAREVRRQLTDLVKKASFLPNGELAPQGKSSKRKRDPDGEPRKRGPSIPPWRGTMSDSQHDVDFGMAELNHVLCYSRWAHHRCAQKSVAHRICKSPCQADVTAQRLQDSQRALHPRTAAPQHCSLGCRRIRPHA